MAGCEEFVTDTRSFAVDHIACGSLRKNAGIGVRLYCDGVDVASVEIAGSALQKMKGLLGRTGINGAMYFPDVPSVHTFFMRFAIDVAFLDKANVVQHVQTIKPWRITGKHNSIRNVVEANAGAFEMWKIKPGSQLEIHP